MKFSLSLEWTIESWNYWNNHQLFSAVARQIPVHNWSPLAQPASDIDEYFMHSSPACLTYLTSWLLDFSSSPSLQQEEFVQQLDSQRTPKKQIKNSTVEAGRTRHLDTTRVVHHDVNAIVWRHAGLNNRKMKNVFVSQNVLAFSGCCARNPQQTICFSLVSNRFRAKSGGNNRTKSCEND